MATTFTAPSAFAAPVRHLSVKKTAIKPLPPATRHVFIGQDRRMIAETASGLDFLAPDGSVVSHAPFDMVHTPIFTDYSPDGRFVSVSIECGERGCRKGTREKLTVFDSRGKELWAAHGCPSGGYLSPDGQYAVCITMYGDPPVFINHHGIMNKEVLTPEFVHSSSWIYGEPGAQDFSRDSDLFAFSVWAGSNSAVALFDHTGRLLFQKVPGIVTDHFHFSKDDKVLFVMGHQHHQNPSQSRSSELQARSTDSGKLLWRHTGLLASDYVFAVDETGQKILAASNGSNTVYCFSIRDGHLLWEYSEPGFGAISFMRAIPNGNNVVLAGQEFDAKKARQVIVVLGWDGEELARTILPKATIPYRHYGLLALSLVGDSLQFVSHGIVNSIDLGK
ncbi:MAG: PQQ-like beta-propeller repeat protein [Elusimicrobia bacterium]|nr:PQQ-like beta-propeller repeat protein [Elusimicrobiota bacterium]